MVRAKFYVASVTKFGSCHDGKAQTNSINVVCHPVTNGCEENKSFSKWTPSGKLELSITNPDVFDFFKEGSEIYLDISQVSQPKS
jgi:hypothetical protein